MSCAQRNISRGVRWGRATLGALAGPGVILLVALWSCSSASAATSKAAAELPSFTVTAAPVSSMSYVFALSCPSATCVAVGSDYATGDPAVLSIANGLPGTPEDIPGAIGDADGISCVTAVRCIAVGESPSFVAPVADGQPGPATTTSDPGGVDGVSCSSAVACEVVGQDSSSEYGVAAVSGQSWEVFHRFAGSAGFVADGGEPIACWSAEDCLVGGSVGEYPNSSGATALINDGKPSSIQAPQRVVRVTGGTEPRSMTANIGAVACPDGPACLAVGAAVVGSEIALTPDSIDDAPTERPTVSIVDDGVWKQTWQYPVDGQFEGISCPARTLCVGIAPTDQGAILARFSDGRPGPLEDVTTTGDPGQLDEIACPPGSNRCEAIGLDAVDNPIVAAVPIPPAGSAPAGTKLLSATSTKSSQAVKTKLDFSYSEGKPRPRARVVLTAQLYVPSADMALNGPTITLEARAARGGRWRVVGRQRARPIGGRAGEVRWVVHPGVDTRYRVLFAGRRGYAKSSATDEVFV